MLLPNDDLKKHLPSPKKVTSMLFFSEKFYSSFLRRQTESTFSDNMPAPLLWLTLWRHQHLSEISFNQMYMIERIL